MFSSCWVHAPGQTGLPWRVSLPAVLNHNGNYVRLLLKAAPVWNSPVKNPALLALFDLGEFEFYRG